MRTLNFHGLYILGTPLLVALSIAIMTGAPAKSDPKMSVRTAVIASTAKPKFSPPHAGVKLLEDILNKMRATPQLAMKNKQGLMKQQQIADDQQQGATDQFLAIKPKEPSSVALAKDSKSKERQIAMLPKSGFYQQQAQSLSQGSSRPVNLLRGNTAPGSNYASPGDSQYSPEQSRARQELKSTAASGADGNVIAYGTGHASNPVSRLRDALTAVSGMTRVGSMAPASPSAMPQANMGARVDRTSQTTRLIAQKQTDKDYGATQAQSQSLSRGVAAASRFSFAPNAWSQAAPRKVASSAGGYVNEYNAGVNSSAAQSMDQPVVSQRMQAASSGASAAIAPGSAGGFGGGYASNSAAEADVVAARPPQPVSAYKYTREYGNNARDAEKAAGDEYAEDAQSEFRSKRKSESESSKKTLVALLPPSVVTGIPLIRLGISETEANSGLASMGSLNKENISNWNVWSLQRAGSKDTSLQVYIRHNRVEAIRIFDPTLIAPDFGVKLGDELPTVKQKFGEPAFMVPEPTARAGQNYVYPISQVSFQLSRIGSNQKPQVVSLLIFNVQ